MMNKGALIEYDKLTSDILTAVRFQFNPDRIQRSFETAPPESDSDRNQEQGQAAVYLGESLSLTIQFSATEQLASINPIPRLVGISPSLVALEKMAIPKGSFSTGEMPQVVDAVREKLNLGASKSGGGTAEIPRFSMPSLLFSWGVQRLLPVEITSLAITEQEYSSFLVPVRADVALKLKVLRPTDIVKDKVGPGVLNYTETIKGGHLEVSKAAALKAISDVIPF